MDRQKMIDFIVSHVEKLSDEELENIVEIIKVFNC